MAYNTKPIAKDVDGNPISQYYNPETDQYEPVEGKNGANKVLVMNNDLSLQPILDKLDQLTGTVIDEETRKSNEIERQNNEQNRIQLYNALLAELERIEQIEQQVPESVLEAVDNLKNEIGNLLELQTNEKSNLIGAINEINQKVENIEVVDMEAINVSYDNAESGLAANNIQEAIDEINTKIDEIEIVDMDAVNVSYDNTESEIEAENVQDAIDEINENLTAHLADYAKEATMFTIESDNIYQRTNCVYYKKNGFVYLSLSSIQKKDATAFEIGEIVATLPVGFRPKQTAHVQGMAQTGAKRNSISLIVYDSGQVQIGETSNSKIRLSVSYYAGGGTV